MNNPNLTVAEYLTQLKQDADQAFSYGERLDIHHHRAQILNVVNYLERCLTH